MPRGRWADPGWATFGRMSREAVFSGPSGVDVSVPFAELLGPGNHDLAAELVAVHGLCEPSELDGMVPSPPVDRRQVGERLERQEIHGSSRQSRG